MQKNSSENFPLSGCRKFPTHNSHSVSPVFRRLLSPVVPPCSITRSTSHSSLVSLINKSIILLLTIFIPLKDVSSVICEHNHKNKNKQLLLFFFSALSPPSFYVLHHNNHQNHDNHYDQDNHDDHKSDDLDFDNQVSSSYGSSLALAGTSSDETEPFLTTLHASGQLIPRILQIVCFYSFLHFSQMNWTRQY